MKPSPDFGKKTTDQIWEAREYILARCKKNHQSGCWIWSLALTRGGYGKARYAALFGRKCLTAHRLSFQAFKGIPPKLFVCHHCDTPSCVNPDHLFEGTAKDNVADMIAKGRKNVDYKPRLLRMKARLCTRHRGKWQAQACFGGHRKYLGLFKDKSAATNASLNYLKSKGVLFYE